MPKIKLEEVTNIISLLEEKKVLKYRHKDKVSSAWEIFANTGKCAWYLGKTRKEDNSMYDADFITAIVINAINYNQKTGKKAIVVQTTGVYDILKSQEDIHAISIAEQKQLISDVISKYFGNKAKDMIEFRLLDDMHPRLFELIRTKWIDGLETEQQIDLSQAPNDSLSLAQYLYRAMQHNPKLQEKMFGLKQWLDQNDVLNPYYGMLEVACRLSDFLHGTNTQCGEVRQNIYDDIIKTILYGDIKKYPELQTLQQEYTRPKTQWVNDDRPNFNTIYVDGKKFDEYIKEQLQERKLSKQKNIKSFAQIALLALLMWTWIYAGNKMYEQYQKECFLEQKQKQIKDNLLASYAPNKVEYFNEQIDKSIKIIKTFYGIQDDSYVQGLVRPYMNAHPELTKYIMQQTWEWDLLYIGIPICNYIAMLIMKDQEKINFLEFYGDDQLWYKKYDIYIPNMLATLQYYDSIYATNGDYIIKPEQELTIAPWGGSAQGVMWLDENTDFLGEWLLDDGESKTNVYLIDEHPYTNKKPNRRLLATWEGVWKSNGTNTRDFITNYLSYRQNARYLARQAAIYIKEQIRKDLPVSEKWWEYEEFTYLHDIEHTIQEFILHGGNTKPYLQSKTIGKDIVEDILLKNDKFRIFFREHVLIDIDTMKKLPEYNSRRGTPTRWEGSAYRNTKEYDQQTNNFFKRD